MKTHKLIVLRFWVKSDVNPLCVDWVHVSLVLNLPDNPLSKDPIVVSEPGSCGDRLKLNLSGDPLSKDPTTSPYSFQQMLQILGISNKLHFSYIKSTATKVGMGIYFIYSIFLERWIQL